MPVLTSTIVDDMAERCDRLEAEMVMHEVGRDEDEGAEKERGAWTGKGKAV